MCSGRNNTHSGKKQHIIPHVSYGRCVSDTGLRAGWQLASGGGLDDGGYAYWDSMGGETWGGGEDVAAHDLP